MMECKKQSNFFARCALCLVGVLLLVACFGMSGQRASAESPTFVRIIHASPDIGVVDVFVDGTKILSNLPFGMVTNYATIPPGSHMVQISLTGKGTNAAVITENLVFNPGLAYTIAALGTTNLNLSLNTFTDNNQLAMGKAKVRVYQLSPGTGTLNLLQNKTPLVSGLTFGSASDYLNFAPGAYTFTGASSVASALPPISATLQANNITSIFAVGVIGGTPQFQFVTAQAAGWPGVPQTGSDPRPQTTSETVSQSPLILWLLAAISAGLLATRAMTRRSRAQHVTK